MKYLVILLSVHTLHKTANNLQSAVTKEVNLEKKIVQSTSISLYLYSVKYYVLLLTCCSIIHSRLSGYVSTKLKKVWILSSYFRSREKIVDRQTRKNNLDNDRNSENNIIFTRSFNMRSRKKNIFLSTQTFKDLAKIGGEFMSVQNFFSLMFTRSILFYGEVLPSSRAVACTIVLQITLMTLGY